MASGRCSVTLHGPRLAAASARARTCSDFPRRVRSDSASLAVSRIRLLSISAAGANLAMAAMPRERKRSLRCMLDSLPNSLAQDVAMPVRAREGDDLRSFDGEFVV